MRPLLNRLQAAAMLGKPPSWVSYKVQRGELPFTRCGLQLRFRPEDLERWIEENTFTPAPSTRGARRAGGAK